MHAVIQKSKNDIGKKMVVQNIVLFQNVVM